MPKEKSTNCYVAGLELDTAHYLLELCLPDCISYSSAKDAQSVTIHYPINTEAERIAIYKLIGLTLISIHDNKATVSFTVTVTRKGWEKMFEIINELKRAGKIRTGHTSDGITPGDYPPGLRTEHLPLINIRDAGSYLATFG